MKGKQKERQPGVRYRECLRNYALSHGDALSQGRQVRDGCCEFTPGGPEGTAEYFLCEACRCHRNFHRAETEGQIAYESCYHRGFPGAPGNCWMDPSPTIAVSPAVNPLPTAAMALPVTALAIRPGEEYAGACHSSVSAQENSGKKRFRTKLTAEQKGRMLSFSERVGWKIQKYADAEIEQFCREIGVERKVLRVWMHNNKHVFTKPSQPSSWAQNATAMAQPSAWAQDATARAYNNADQAYDNSETTATNSTSNNDSTQSERDFQ